VLDIKQSFGAMHPFHFDFCIFIFIHSKKKSRFSVASHVIEAHD